MILKHYLNTLAKFHRNETPCSIYAVPSDRYRNPSPPSLLVQEGEGDGRRRRSLARSMSVRQPPCPCQPSLHPSIFASAKPVDSIQDIPSGRGLGWFDLYFDYSAFFHFLRELMGI